MIYFTTEKNVLMQSWNHKATETDDNSLVQSLI